MKLIFAQNLRTN